MSPVDPFTEHIAGYLWSHFFFKSQNWMNVQSPVHLPVCVLCSPWKKQLIWMCIQWCYQQPSFYRVIKKVIVRSLLAANTDKTTNKSGKLGTNEYLLPNPTTTCQQVLNPKSMDVLCCHLTPSSPLTLFYRSWQDMLCVSCRMGLNQMAVPPPAQRPDT